jgi:phosphatidylglycerol:prolipoprotein diacylglycerol transferase
MLAILAAVGLVLERCRRFGLDADKVLSLCFWMVIIGILGARIFFVVQKFGSFEGASLMDLLDMTKGGLVVYGSLVGGVLAALVCFWYSKLPVLETLDVLAPAMVLGLAIGRIGCLMNGCCYGGPCSVDYPMGLRFPAGSTPYMEQLTEGSLLGLVTTQGPSGEGYRIVERVEPGSIGEELGISAGEKMAVYAPDPVRLAAVDWKNEKPSGLTIDIDADRTGTRSILVERVNNWSLPIHPTQIYASINAALLCWVLWLLSERRQFAGQVFAVLIIVYPVSRFLLEIIRQDESGVFGTDLTISQWFSIFLLFLGCGFYFVLYSRHLKPGPAGTSLLPKI